MALLLPHAASVTSNLFSPGTSILEKVVRTLLVFAFLAVALYLGGRREIGQLNTLDLAVLLLASNALQNAMIGNDNSVLGGVIGATTLFVANFGIARLVTRNQQVSKIIDRAPLVVVDHGSEIDTVVHHQAISEGELRAAAWDNGYGTIADVDLMVLEGNGRLAVLSGEAALHFRETPDYKKAIADAEVRRTHRLRHRRAA